MDEVKINKSKVSLVDILEQKPENATNEKDQTIEQIDDQKEEIEAPELEYDGDEDVEEIRKRLMILSRYKNSKRFGKWLREQGFILNAKKLEGKTQEELDTIINDIRYCISTKNTNSLYETGATKGIVVLENLLRPVYKIDGLSTVLSNDPMYLDLVEEMMLERASFIYVKPEYRLLYCVLSSAYIVHNQHIMLEKLSQTSEGKQMIKEMASRFKENENVSETPQIQIYKPIGPQVVQKQMDSTFSDKYADLLNL